MCICAQVEVIMKSSEILFLKNSFFFLNFYALNQGQLRGIETKKYKY